MDMTVSTQNEDKEDFFQADYTKTRDHISGLPEDILSFILSLLTVGDAVKTRVLSPRWRYLTAASSDLHFDLFTIFGINYDGEYLSKNSDRLWEDKFRFISAVDQCLQQCKKTKSNSFKVCYGLGNDSARYVDMWIDYAVRMGIEKLDLDFSFIPRDCELYIFPCHLFPQGKASHLKHLYLQSCLLKPSPDFTSCLNSLNTLHLSATYLDQHTFDDIRSVCINLENLKLENCSLPAFSIFGQFPCLKLLALEECHGVIKIEISCINLATFVYNGTLLNLSFVGVTSLEKVSLMALVGIEYVFDGLAQDLPQLQTLSVGLFASRVPHIPEYINNFSHLKELELIVILTGRTDLLSAIFLLNACPCLQKFHLAVRHCGGHGVKRAGVSYPRQCYYRLKEVAISGSYNRCNAWKLAVYLINNAIGLEKIIVDSKKFWNCEFRRWKYSKKGLSRSEKKRLTNILLKEKAYPNVKIAIR